MENNLTENIEKNNLNKNNSKEILDEVISEIQNNCLKSEFGKVINTALDVGIRTIFPEFINEQIISLKNNIYNYGFKDGLGQSINETIDAGKKELGVLTDNFESIYDIQNVLNEGGIIDKISDLLDEAINNLKKSELINSQTAKKLKSEKNTILKSVKKDIDKSFNNQNINFEKMEKYISNWKNAYNSQDFNSMQKEYKKMEKIMEDLIPIEKTINEFRKIENIQTLIKNNGKNFDLTQEELELANKLIK